MRDRTVIYHRKSPGNNDICFHFANGNNFVSTQLRLPSPILEVMYSLYAEQDATLRRSENVAVRFFLS